MAHKIFICKYFDILNLDLKKSTDIFWSITFILAVMLYIFMYISLKTTFFSLFQLVSAQFITSYFSILTLRHSLCSSFFSHSICMYSRLLTTCIFILGNILVYCGAHSVHSSIDIILFWSEFVLCPSGIVNVCTFCLVGLAHIEQLYPLVFYSYVLSSRNIV